MVFPLLVWAALQPTSTCATNPRCVSGDSGRTMPTDSKRILPQVIRVVEQAGASILKYYRSQVEVIYKKDQSPLTEADLVAHRMIVKELKRLTPRIPIISEESEPPGFELLANRRESQSTTSGISDPAPKR